MVKEFGLQFVEIKAPTVLFEDNFNGTLLNWEQTAGTISIDNTKAYEGEGSLKTQTVDAGVGTATKVMTLIDSKKIKVTLRMTPSDGGVNWTYIEFALYYIDNLTGIAWYGVLRYERAGKKFQYKNASDTWVNITSNKFNLSSPAIFHYIEFAIDFEKHEFIYFKVYDTYFDLTGIALKQISFGFDYQCLYFYVSHDSSSGVLTMHVDTVKIEEYE